MPDCGDTSSGCHAPRHHFNFSLKTLWSKKGYFYESWLFFLLQVARLKTSLFENHILLLLLLQSFFKYLLRYLARDTLCNYIHYLKILFPSNTGRSEPSNYYYYLLLSLQYNIELKGDAEMYLQRGKIGLEKRLITFTQKTLEKERTTTKTKKQEEKGTRIWDFLL